jgi:hypothetical protein
MSTNGGPRHSNRVAQASGMVSVQAGCSADEAVTLMQARADETHVSLDGIADAVLDGTMRFGVS